MSKEPMPATEAERDTNTYELAFHVLPTVAEGEVTAVVDTIKSHIAANGGTVVSEEAPARFELAYEIIKYLEGRNRKFTSAYFGWIRFSMTADKIEALNAEITDLKEILRAMIIKLTKVEAENPFYFHESINVPRVETIEISDDESDEDDDDGVAEAVLEDTEDSADDDDDGEKDD
jgi:ribosomal protein S6